MGRREKDLIVPQKNSKRQKKSQLHIPTRGPPGTPVPRVLLVPKVLGDVEKVVTTIPGVHHAKIGISLGVHSVKFLTPQGIGMLEIPRHDHPLGTPREIVWRGVRQTAKVGGDKNHDRPGM